MGQYPLNQTVWRRGWNDTKAVWTSWQFVVLDAVVTVVIVGVFGWYWGLAAIVFGMTCAWMGMTASAPVRQRNEARSLLLAKPKPVPLLNRDSLIRAMLAVQEKAIDVKMCRGHFNLKEKHKEDSQKEFYKLSDAWIAYYDATQVLENEQMLAGDHFKGIVLGWLSFVNYHVDDCMGYLKRVENKPEPLKATEFMGQIKDYTEWTIRELDSANLRVLDKGDSQI